jgi:hypothetical protein
MVICRKYVFSYEHDVLRNAQEPVEVVLSGNGWEETWETQVPLLKEQGFCVI